MNGAQGQPSLSFVPAADISTYMRSFYNSTGGGAERIGGNAARQVLMQSRLPVSELGRIWELSDINKQGSLSAAEFVLAMFLAQSRIKGKALPDTLPLQIRAEVETASNTAKSAYVAISTTPALTTPQNMVMSNPLASNASLQQQLPPPMPMSAAASSARPVAAMSPPMQQLGSAAALPAQASEAAESVQEFESRFPDISGGGAPSGGSSTALNSVRQSFGQNVLGSRVAESQHQWAITGTERAQYEAIFRKWDSGRRGVLGGAQAREVFAQSGLAQRELAQIWSLADINNQGELNLNEFSVAMHLIFRRLAGAPIPDSLPPELVPRSSKDFMDSLSAMKEQLMFKDVNKPRPAAVSRTATPVASGISTGRASSYATDNDDDDDTYRSANRHRRRNKQQQQQYESTTGRSSVEPPSRDTGESLEQLRASVKQRRERIELLKKDMDRLNSEQAEGRVTLRWRIDTLKREIEELHRTTPQRSSAAGGSGESGERGRFLAKRNKLVASISDLVNIVPALAADYQKLSNELADAAKDVLKAREAKGSASADSANDMESRAARLVAQRMAALTGQTMDELDNSANEQKSELARIEKQHQERLDRMQSVTSGLTRVQSVMSNLGLSSSSLSSDAQRWEEGVGVKGSEVLQLIRRLQTIPRPAATQPQQASAASTSVAQKSAFSPVQSSDSASLAAAEARPASAASSVAQRLAGAASQEDRDRILREIAEERFRERERALGISEPESKPEPESRLEPPVSISKPSNVIQPETGFWLDEGTPFKSPISSEAQPEMQMRSPGAAKDKEPVAATAEMASVSATNPFPTHRDADTNVYKDIFSQSLEVPDDSSSSSSSDNEWDHDSSDDENNTDLLGLGTKPQPSTAAGNSTSESSISFNTAFANPSAEPKPSEALEELAKEGTNPFLGLLAAAASVANDTSASGDNNDSNTGSKSTADLLSDFAPEMADFKKQRVRALYPYTADAEADELSITTGDLIETRPVPAKASAGTHAGEGWMYGEILKPTQDDQGDGWEASGKQGWFPAEFAEVLGEIGSRGWNKTKARFGSAKYDYEPQHDDELKVQVGDRVRIVDGDIDESWWKVRKLRSGNGERAEGMLPAMYIDLDKP
ncbi:actin organization and endocytosis protein [Coemansia brasiliensis]|uniref:Actin organization and endocytosis protein n=1 Tax=Coemansia brasiliensis TaxID=2650707 RepID=A0A9W8M0Y0_9FUNG|nr:actin organization and endocytosis protein [Coemansia brasiliensis]